jgi:beta-phosphoglucomutase
MKIKAVIFDMDGVLIDAREWHYEALNRALKHFGGEITRYEHLNTFDGLPTKKKLKMLSDEGRLPEKLHTFINELKQDYTMEITHTSCKPFFQHQYLLAKLKKSGYKIIVCSNSIRNTIELMMEKSGLNTYLDFFLSNQDVVNAKPSPEIYNKAIQMLKLNPTECLIVEDNENGIKAAIASGANLLKVSSPEEVNYTNIFRKLNELNNA